VPGAAGGEGFRVVVDETGFDFRGLNGEELSDRIDAFNDALSEIQSRYAVGVGPWWDEVECDEDLELCQFLYEPAARDVSRDSRVRLGLLMQRCRTWDTDLDGLGDRVTVEGQDLESAWSISYALRQALGGKAAACLVFPTASRSGWLLVSGAAGMTEVFFLHDADDLTRFWQGLFQREDVPENEFFDHAREAFPHLAFANTLTFRKFDGTYRDLRDWVVHALSIVNDHFPSALVKHSGQQLDIQAELGSMGLELSRESQNTRRKPEIMKQRDVEHEGETFRCEWHAKQHPARNRLHFSIPEPRLGGRVLIGIFVDHLET
jgi:hypothetical protein